MTPHRCPICDGTGLVSRPPGVAGDVPQWSSTSLAHPCPAGCVNGLLWANESAELSALQRINDQNAHDFKQLRDALKCDGSDLPQLLSAVEALQKTIAHDKKLMDEIDSERQSALRQNEALHAALAHKTELFETARELLHKQAETELAELYSLRAQNQTLRNCVEYVAGLQNLFFAECSQAEEIVQRCKQALAQSPEGKL